MGRTISRAVTAWRGAGERGVGGFGDLCIADSPLLVFVLDGLRIFDAGPSVGADAVAGGADLRVDPGGVREPNPVASEGVDDDLGVERPAGPQDDLTGRATMPGGW